MVTAGANFIVGNGAIILQGIGYSTLAGGGAFMAVGAYRNHQTSNLQNYNKFNKTKFVSFVNSKAYSEYSRETCGNCAYNIRLGLEEGGLNTSGHPEFAKNYGPFLMSLGFDSIDRTNYVPELGDIKVIQSYEGGSRAGHINTFNGQRWVSDFYETDDWPGRGYREHKPWYTVYRWMW